MKPDLFSGYSGPWRGHLAVVTRALAAGIGSTDEVAGWRSIPLDWIFTCSSLLEPEEAARLELAHEGEVAQSTGVGFVSFPIPDRGIPASIPATLSLLKTIADALEKGRNVAVHCRQGIGRSGLIAVGVLVNSGIAVENALNAVSAARGLAVPETPEQIEWIRHLISDSLVVTR